MNSILRLGLQKVLDGACIDKDRIRGRQVKLLPINKGKDCGGVIRRLEQDLLMQLQQLRKVAGWKALACHPRGVVPRSTFTKGLHCSLSLHV